jgi:hypothetical protein
VQATSTLLWLFLVILCRASLVPGEEEKELKTDSFAMNVKADTAANLEGQPLAGGTVQVPAGALDNASSDAVAAKVTTWTDAGPLFYAKDWSPAGSNSSKLKSPLLTVVFEDGGAELVVANLTGEPFVVMPVPMQLAHAIIWQSLLSLCSHLLHETSISMQIISNSNANHCTTQLCIENHIWSYRHNRRIFLGCS